MRRLSELVRPLRSSSSLGSTGSRIFITARPGQQIAMKSGSQRVMPYPKFKRPDSYHPPKVDSKGRLLSRAKMERMKAEHNLKHAQPIVSPFPEGMTVDDVLEEYKKTLNNPKMEKTHGMKNRNPIKRAGALLEQLELEEMVKGEKRIEIPYFEPGDAIQVKYAPSTVSDKFSTVQGVVIGKRNRGYNSSFRLLCSLAKERIEFIFPYYTPLIREIKVLRWSYIHRSTKRSRKSKLYWVRDRPQSLYMVKPNLEAVDRPKWAVANPLHFDENIASQETEQAFEEISEAEFERNEEEYDDNNRADDDVEGAEYLDKKEKKRLRKEKENAK